jgi:hypothetical protein
MGVLALLVFAALPNSLAGPCLTCCAPTCTFYYDEPNNTLRLYTTYPSNALIFYTKTVNTANTNDPCHVGADPCTNVGYTTFVVPNGTYVPLGQGETHLRMVAWRSDRGDSPVATCSQQNPPQ